VKTETINAANTEIERRILLPPSLVIARSASDETIQHRSCRTLDCFASLAMTAFRLFRYDNLRSDDDVLALTDMPGNHQTLDPIHDPEQDDAEQRQDHECCEHGRQVEGSDRALQHISNA
jgi:hypothetical protein